MVEVLLILIVVLLTVIAFTLLFGSAAVLTIIALVVAIAMLAFLIWIMGSKAAVRKDMAHLSGLNKFRESLPTIEEYEELQRKRREAPRSKDDDNNILTPLGNRIWCYGVSIILVWIVSTIIYEHIK